MTAISKEDFVREAIEKDATLKRKLFSDELDKYIRNYKALHDNYKTFVELIGQLNSFPSREVPQFINKLMPVVLANLSQKHELIVKLSKSNSYWDKVLVATPNGIRARSESGYHTADLNARNIREMFTTKSAEVEVWISANKPKKLQDWIDFKNAFVNGFKDEYCDSESSNNSNNEDKSTIEIDRKIPRRELSWISENKHRSDYSIERMPFSIDEISIRYNIPRSHGCIYFMNNEAPNVHRGVLNVSDSSYMQFDEDDALKMMEIRELLPILNQMIDEAKVKMDDDNKLARAWWVQFNKTMNKWVSMINL